MSRAFLGILSRVLLVIFTFVLTPIGTGDHFPYLRRRVPAITVGPTDVGPFHTTGDTTASVDPQRIRGPGEVVVQALLEMGASE